MVLIYCKDPTIYGAIFGFPIFGNPHMVDLLHVIFFIQLNNSFPVFSLSPEEATCGLDQQETFVRHASVIIAKEAAFR